MSETNSLSIRLSQYATQIQAIATLLDDDARSTIPTSADLAKSAAELTAIADELTTNTQPVLTDLATALRVMASRLRIMVTPPVPRTVTYGPCQSCGNRFPLTLLAEYDGTCPACFTAAAPETQMIRETAVDTDDPGDSGRHSVSV
jgi:hypothetical protein